MKCFTEAPESYLNALAPIIKFTALFSHRFVHFPCFHMFYISLDEFLHVAIFLNGVIRFFLSFTKDMKQSKTINHLGGGFGNSFSRAYCLALCGMVSSQSDELEAILLDPAL